MGFVIFLLFLFAAILLFNAFSQKRYFFSINKKLVTIITISVLVLILIIASIRIVPPGYVGVKVLLGNVSKTVLPNGLHLVVPIVNVVKMNVRTQAYTMSKMSSEGQKRGDDAIRTLSKDGLQINLDVTIWYRLIPSEAARVYQTIGPYYITKIVRPAIRTAIRDVTVKYAVVDIYSEKRAEVTSEIKNELDKAFEKRGVVCERVLLRNVELPQKIRTSIQEKLSAEQDAQKMEFVLQKEKKEAERKKIEATGISNYQKIITKSLSNKYLQWYYIRNIQELVKNKSTATVIMPFDKGLTPLLNIK
ncbi:MAG: prohibitin family protein [Proteobacteria bacterium]|nr:prohibitin family protein [Pseudomonadota bacterium]